MATDSTMLSFQMNEIYANWPANDVYGCSQNTLTQLQEKVLRSLSKKREEDSLQVVPENDNVFQGDLSPSPRFAMHEVVSCEKRTVKESQNISYCRTEPRTEIKRILNYPWSPRLNKSTLLDAFNSAEPLRTPTFPFSPLVKNPGESLSPASPLAMMLLSPFGRKLSEDLSMYLPENFTPAATLERLERSVSTTVFEFPVVEQTQDECKGAELKREEGERKKIADKVQIDDSGADEYLQANAQDLEVFFNLNDADNCFGVCEVEHYEQPALTQNKGGRKRRRQKEIGEGGGIVVGFRNKLERKRRSEMNSKYDKLRQCIPEIESRHKVSKILVLKSAVQYIQELQKQDELLTKQKNIEKLKNDELLKNLVRISS